MKNLRIEVLQLYNYLRSELTSASTWDKGVGPALDVVVWSRLHMQTSRNTGRLRGRIKTSIYK